ncbi:hypothetical protein [Prochlorococcus sp. MIT 1300]|uniref:hypothetical protein n=1 Tax=Prochlorococcus sp. MIT 1300 TaxID=3096218 RepID=UPI002A75527E|nr:hypothetical protein [Prochlorococcus sp. MIT 1300]
MINKSSSKAENTDSIIRHFILLGIFTFDILSKFLELFKKETIKEDPSTKTSLETLKRAEVLDRSSDDDLKNALSGTDILSKFNRNDLIGLVISCPDALNNILLKERREYLMKLTNQELKLLLAGTQQLYKLKKTELVELIIQKEQTQ